ncbi:MAG: ComF family protein [Parcubacteria group bacterium]
MKILKQTQEFILDTLFPIQCVSCGHPNIWLCENCLQKIQLLSFQLCPQCEQLITQNGRLCSFCKARGAPLDALVVATRYKEGSVSKLVHLYKYNFIEDLSAPLGKLLAKALLDSGSAVPDMIIPVPLHSRRLRWRGFNQAEFLANYIGFNLTPGYAIPILGNVLKRIRYTPPQMKIKDYFQRGKNMRDVFSVAAGPLQLKNKTILLIDDVATTGATLFECAKALKQNGAKKVCAAVIARQEME